MYVSRSVRRQPACFCRDQNNRSKKKGEFHGKGGLMQVENARYMNPLTKLFFKACEQAGLSENEDFNDWSRSQEGFGRFQVHGRNTLGAVLTCSLVWGVGDECMWRLLLVPSCS